MVVALVTTVASAIGGARAEAYVQTRTDMGAPYYWKESCAPVTIYLNRFVSTSGMKEVEVVKSVVAAAHAWSADASCVSDGVTTGPSFEIVPTLASDNAAPPAVAWDARNSIIFRTPPEAWGKSGSGSLGSLYPFEALAVTTVTALGDGHIVDVDMEINGVDKQWMNIDPGVAPPVDRSGETAFFDLQNALTHEFGHFIGLAHTCVDESAVTTGTRPMDDQGNLVPVCNSPTDTEASVMSPDTEAGKVNKRTLFPDDIKAVCAIYGPSRAAEVCSLDHAPGCAVGGATELRSSGWRNGLAPAAAGLCGVLAALATLTRRRRASERSRRRARA